jgi:Spy/CpxP family protein refolding chaperone
MMIKKPYLLVSLLLTLGVSATFLFAQKPDGPPDPATRVQRHIQHLTKMLSLTEAQQQQATTIFTNEATGASSIHNDMKTAHQNLNNAIKNNDQNGITQAANTIGNLTSQMIASRAKAQAAFYQILTPDQQTRLSQFESEGPGMRHFGGPPHF